MSRENSERSANKMPLASTHLPRSPYHSLFARLNKLAIKEWLFAPGMLFDDKQKWWGEGGNRITRHEGIDLCLYRDMSSDVQQLQAGASVPVLFDGTVQATIDDFLAKSVFVRHEQYRVGTAVLFTVYGHVMPLSTVPAGKQFGAGDCLGGIVATIGKRPTMYPHLHISAAWFPAEVADGELNWKTIAERKVVRLIDPLSLMDLPYSRVSSV